MYQLLVFFPGSIYIPSADTVLSIWGEEEHLGSSLVLHGTRIVSWFRFPGIQVNASSTDELGSTARCFHFFLWKREWARGNEILKLKNENIHRFCQEQGRKKNTKFDNFSL